MLRARMRTGIHVALLAGTGWLLAIAGPWTMLPAMIAFGLVQVALFAPAHEATHQTAFASRRANQVVGWLAACPSLLNLQFYTAFHFAHHRHTQIPGRDPELDMAAPNNLAGYVRRVLGVPYLAAAAAGGGGCLARRSEPLSVRVGGRRRPALSAACGR